MEYSAEALGWAIRSLREEAVPKLTQVELGKRAGYGAGAGVSISRIESGQTRPGPDKLERIAEVLGSTASEITRGAARRTEEQAVGDPASATAAGTRAGLPLRQRLVELQQTVERRTTTVTELADAFNAAHDRARDEFFLRFVSDAGQVDGAPQPPEPSGLTEEEGTEPAAAAEYRLRLTSSGIAKALGGIGGAAAGAAAGGAAAYAAFTAAALLGTASTGVTISGLSGVAAANATLALLGGGALTAGGAGVAGGTMLLAGLVAAPAAVLAVGGFVWMARRTKQRDAELRERLDQAEREIAATERGFRALTEALSQATRILDYIAIHAAHAEHRWSARLHERPVAWSALTPDQQCDYQRFVRIAGCQLSVAGLNAGAYITARGADLEELVHYTDELLDGAERVVTALV